MKKILLLLYRIFFPIALTVLFLLFLPRLILFFLPFSLGAILAFLAEPLITLFKKAFPFLKKEQLSVLVILFLFCTLAALLYLLVLLVFPFISHKMAGFPEYILSLKNTAFETVESIRILLPEALRGIFSDLPEKMEHYGKNILKTWSSPAIKISLHLVSGLPELLLYFVIMILSAFSFIKDGGKILCCVKEIIPESFRHYGELLREDGKKILKGYILAQFQIMLCVFLLLAVGFSVLKVPYGIFLAFLTAFLDALPIFGVGFIMWPWMAMLLFEGQFVFFFALLFLYILSQMIRQFLQPKIIGDAVGLPPILALLFLFLGYKFYGLSGMVLALPAGMLLLRFYHYGAYDGLLSAAKELRELLISYL